MKVNKKLFKLLRAGGLGHTAAIELSSVDGRYGLGQVDGFDTHYDYAMIAMRLGNATVASAYAKTFEQTTYLENSPILPIAAAGTVRVEHVTSVAEDVVLPDGTYFMDFHKVADANGIPIAPVNSSTNVSRVDGVLTLPAAAGGFTPTDSAGALVLTQATAGWYVIGASFTRNDIPQAD